MPQLIVVTATQVKTFRERFEQMLAQDEAEQARLREAEKRREAEFKSLLNTKPAMQTYKEEEQS